MEVDAKSRARSVSKLGRSLKELESETFVFQMNTNCHGYKMSFPEAKAALIPISEHSNIQ